MDLDAYNWIECEVRLPPHGVEVLGWDGFRPRIVWHESIRSKSGVLFGGIY